ncbi:ATP-binding cassette domain-containing protein [Petroclostridium sp. X23]|uniref:ATP-binding cassette domain-containing protein n=1 Tax=Petroclostridium sp. X23 TaxID=3045146 RepID=UPI0024AE81AD|nr:ATP-binding cassette domain-containing protein [Petroclostridium sp. X23]WHH58683.1 ATP-binding cassette domain-containing protein [Petroclostridium sp. X23]
MKNSVPLENLTIEDLFRIYPYSMEFFDINGLPIDDVNNTVKDYITSLPYVFLEDMGLNQENLLKRFRAFMSRMKDIREERTFSIRDITILGGRDKNEKLEEIELKISMGEIICIVGPTGSGKSRLLADIEWMAQRDTPTKRQILIDGSVPPRDWRFSVEHKLVAQLSQNMNFVMDICVGDFIKLHAQSRMIDDIEDKMREIIFHANELSGERFDLNTPLTSLSGGQSRALMVADTAFLSTSPIVLIDEIENAGIHRNKALELLVGQNKIVLIATHDPLLALMGNKRVVIKNGGIQKVIETTPDEKKGLIRLTEIDNDLIKYREALRNGELLDDIK